MRKNFHSTSDILFKTQAIPGVRDLDKSKFTVGYHWDPVRHVSDLKIASIIFPKNLLKNANCLDYIQVSNSLKSLSSLYFIISFVTGYRK